MEHRNLFIELVRVAIGRQKTLSRNLSANEWLEMFNIAYRQTLVAVCFSGIERLPQEQIPPQEILFQWYAITKQTEEQNKLVNERCQQALSFFKENGFNPTILKGQGMAKLYEVGDYTEGVRNIGLRRQSGDIDIWLNGGRSKVYHFAKQYDGEGRLYGVNYHHVHIHLFDDVEVEIHIYPGSLCNPFANRRLHFFFEKHSSESMGDYPNKNFNIIYILLHCYKHFLGHGVGLRQIMDYYFLLKERETIVEKREVKELLKQLGMMKFAQGMMWVMQTTFGLEQEYMFVDPDEEEGKFIMNEIFQTGNMGHHDKRHWGSKKTSFSRFVYNLHRDWHFINHYPQEVLWRPVFSLWQFFNQKFVWK